MDIVIEKTIQKLGFKIGSNRDKIYALFPIPREQTIRWADVELGRRAEGIVLTDTGIFIKGKQIKQVWNSKKCEREMKIEPFYHYIRWEHFDVTDFETTSEGVVFGNAKINLSFDGKRFFKICNDTYESIIKTSAVKVSDTIATVESVFTENHAYINNKAGHGEVVEEALVMIDKIQGKDATVVGRGNEKNGADRLVDGTYIQTKYCKTGQKCINACFDKITGEFRYINKDGSVMQIEVPKDKYADAVNEFRKKILEGKVPGVTNPDDATKYIKKGMLTHKQAVNLCKPGTIESLSYDSYTGVVSCSFAFGITFLTTFIFAYAKTGDREESMKSAVVAGVQVFGLSFFSHILTQQVARTSITKQLIPLSEYLVDVMGSKAVHSIVNALRTIAGKKAIYGATAKKHLAKILRGNAVTEVVAFVVFSIPNTVDIFSKKISGIQFAKNTASLIAAMVAAKGGAVLSAIVIAKIGALIGTQLAPGVGTAIGFVGGMAGGFVGGQISKALGDYIREDDSVIQGRMFNGVVMNMCYDYMLQQHEIDMLVEKLAFIGTSETANLFKIVQASQNQEETISNSLRPHFEMIIRRRPNVKEPTSQDLVQTMKKVVSSFEKIECEDDVALATV